MNFNYIWRFALIITLIINWARSILFTVQLPGCSFEGVILFFRQTLKNVWSCRAEVKIFRSLSHQHTQVRIPTPGTGRDQRRPCHSGSQGSAIGGAGGWKRNVGPRPQLFKSSGRRGHAPHRCAENTLWDLRREVKDIWNLWQEGGFGCIVTPSTIQPFSHRKKKILWAKNSKLFAFFFNHAI